MLTERVQFHWLEVGHCRHPQCMAVQGGDWRSVKFPSLCALIRHPERGWLLYDTGYSPHFQRVTTAWPERLYRMATPVSLPQEACLLQQLQRLGLSADDIGTIVISHFHGDHIAGLRDFARAGFIALRADWEQVRELGRWRGVLDGWLPALLPPDFAARLSFADQRPSRELPVWLRPFQRAFDLLGDGSLLAVPLPGHSRGQLGLLLRHENDRLVLLAADACWSAPACQQGRPPSWIASLLFQDRSAYAATFAGLNRLLREESQLAVLPSHCSSSWQRWRGSHD